MVQRTTAAGSVAAALHASHLKAGWRIGAQGAVHQGLEVRQHLLQHNEVY